MIGNVYSQRKEDRFLTSHKSQFSFCTPLQDQQPTTAPKQALKESRVADYMRNRAELFADDRKENQNILSLINKSYSHDFVQELRNQHRIEIEKLLLEISRLHDHLDGQQRIHKNYIMKLKEESEQTALMRISNLRQSQVSQLEVVDVQLRKTREALEQKSAQFQDLERSSNRKIQNLTHENEVLKNDLRKAIQNKNEEIYKLRGTFDRQSEAILTKKEEELNEMKDLSDKEFRKIEKRLQQQEQSLEDIRRDYEQVQNKKSDLQVRLEEQRIQMEDKIAKVIETQRDKQLDLIASLKQFYHAENEQAEEEIKLQKEMFTTQIDLLIKIIKLKDSEAQRTLMFRETERIQFKLLSENLEKENNELRKKLSWMRRNEIEELELLKVKMGVLHENDIKQLVKVYEAKIDNLTRELKNLGEEHTRVETDYLEQKNNHYKTKKKYDFTVSRLNEEVLVLKTGMAGMEKDFKEKLEGEKSMMMLTSRSIIKEAELKNTNVKFYEEELRKLRQLLEIQAQEVEDSERNVEQKIKMAEDQLTRLSNKILEIKGEAEDAQKKFKAIIADKDDEISRLNELLNTPVELREEAEENEELAKMEEILGEKEDQIRSYKVRCEDLQSQVRHLRGDIERLTIQSQINSEEAKKHYKAISDKNLQELRGFFERRVRELENDKVQLGRINSNQTEQITELIKKYRQVEDAMKELVRQAKKRGDLENRIINLGMDNNLVKNMAELFHK